MTLTEWIAAAVIAAFLAVVLRRYLPEQGLAVGLAAGAVMLLAALAQAVPLFRELKDLLSRGGVDGEYVEIVFKALRDAGEQGLCAKAELAGKLALLSLALPLFRKVGEIALSLIEGGTV